MNFPARGTVDRNAPDPALWWTVLLAPVLLVNAVAFAGQYAWANANLPAWQVDVGHFSFNLTAAAFAAALESIAIYLQYEAHRALMAGDSSLKLRLGSYAVAFLAGALNYWHWSDPVTHAATPAAIAFGALSALSPWLWAIRSRSLHRDQLREQGLIEERAVKFASARWLLYPRRTYRAFRLAVWEGEQDPLAAIALLDHSGAGEAPAPQPAPPLPATADAQPVNIPVEELAPVQAQAGPRLVPPLVANASDRAILAALTEPLGQSELARRSGVAPSTLKLAVKRLGEQGHVEKVGTLYRRRVVA